MTPEEFREHGRRVVDWVADYMACADQYPVLSRVRPGDVRDQLSARAPEEGQPFDEIVGDLDRIIMPGLTHWNSPNFFAFFPANHSGPSILGELVSAGLGVQGMLWATSPACTELETHVLDWLVDAMDLPPAFKSDSDGGGVIQDSASSATLCALLAARERATNFQSNRKGVATRLTAYASSQAHSSIEKAMRIAGVGSDNLRKIDVDETFALRPDALHAAIRADLRQDCAPFFVAATVGTTSSTAMDPLTQIGGICKDLGIWMHVDAAMAGTAALCPEFRSIHEGLQFADSYCFNPHKWMFVNFDCNCFFVADRQPLIRTLSIMPDYLQNQASASGEVIDYRDWQIPLGRRFRSLKLWFVLRSFGLNGLRSRIREHVGLAQEFAGWVDAHPDLERLAPAPLNLVCFAHRAGDARSEQLLQSLNNTGDVFMTHTRLGGRYALRFCVGQASTRRQHVERAWELIKDHSE